MALKVICEPTGTLAFETLMVMAVRSAALTVKEAVAVSVWYSAKMVTGFALASTPVATPLSTVATAVLLDDQFAAEVTSCTVPSLNVALAVKVAFVPFAISAEGGVIVREVGTAFPTVMGTNADCTEL